MRSLQCSIFLCALLYGSNLKASFIDVTTELSETMMGQSLADSILLVQAFGVNPTGISFTSSINANARSFSYSAVGGQTYAGMALSLTTSGIYNPSTGAYDWTTNGQLGGDSWSQSSSSAWVGDPEIKTERNVTVGGDLYTLKFTHSVTDGFTTKSTFSNGTATAPLGGRFGKGPFWEGKISGTDQFVAGDWVYKAILPVGNPLVPDKILIFSGKGDIGTDVGGLRDGTFDVSVSEVPEPTSSAIGLVLSGTAFALLRRVWKKPVQEQQA